MKRLLIVLVAVPALALAAGAFDGTWKTRVDSAQETGKADAYEISQGMYHCTSCVPEVAVKADGTDQKVTGHDYYDSIAVRVVDPTTVTITRKQGDKITGQASLVVSSDGKMLTEKYVDRTGATPVRFTLSYKRLTSGPPGSHALSGGWQQDKIEEASEAGVTVKYQSTPNGLKMDWNGQSYDAKFDGREYPIANDPGKTTVTLKRINAYTIEETDHRGGKVVDVIRMTVSTDGKSMGVTDSSPVRNQKDTYTMIKQS
jgi:hypothetical protein